MKNTFGFIGAGNMGGPVIEAVCLGAGSENVTIFRRTTEKALELAKKTNCTVSKSAEEAVRNSHFVVLCVKPNVLRDVLRDLLPVLSECALLGDEKVICSIAAGVTIDAIAAVLAEASLKLPIIRMLPNTPVAVGQGLTLVIPSEKADKSDVATLCRAMEPGGKVEFIDEPHLDAATPVFSSSPAFVYMFIDALADGGVMAGIPREQAKMFAAQAVLGSAAMVLETGKHPGQLKDEVCSPGGSTIVGVEALERAGFRGAVATAVFEAYKKTTQLGK